MITSKIQEIEQVKLYDGKNGKVYYFTLVMDNGDKGTIGKKSENALKIGDELTYTIESNEYGNRFKPVPQNGFGGGNGFKGGGQKGSTASFALSYCKDIAVAMIPLHPEKTPTDWTTTTLAMADRFQAWLKANEA